MKVKPCCDFDDNSEDGVEFEFFGDSIDMLILDGERHSGLLSDVKYCPFCGKRFELEDDA